MFQIENFIFVAFFSGAVPSNGRYVQHTTTELDEGSTLKVHSKMKNDLVSEENGTRY
jgi:hypothetical protein